MTAMAGQPIEDVCESENTEEREGERGMKRRGEGEKRCEKGDAMVAAEVLV